MYCTDYFNVHVRTFIKPAIKVWLLHISYCKAESYSSQDLGKQGEATVVAEGTITVLEL